MPTRYDVISLDRATITPEGWIKDTPIVTRAGIFEYRRADGTIRKEFRPPEEVFDAASLESMAGIPVTTSHQGGLFHADHTDGIVGSVISSGRRQDDKDEKNYNVVAALVVHQPKGIGKKRELSLGYTLQRVDETPGEWNGQKYDAVQRGIRMNHIAFVERGRAGVARLRMDAADAVSGLNEEDFEVPDPKLVTVRVDGLEYQASPEVGRALEKAMAEATAAAKRADTAEAERDTLKTKVTEAEANVVKARADGFSQAKNRLGLEEQAKALKVTIKDGETDRSIRESMVRAVRGDTIDFTGKSDDYLMAMFDSAMADHKAKGGDQRLDNAALQRQVVTPPAGGAGGTRPGATGGARAARARLASDPGSAYRA